MVTNKILFAGTGSIALPTFSYLCDNFNVVALLTAPSKQMGRKGQDECVKTEAQKRGIEVLQPEHLKENERRIITSLGPDTLISFSYGRIFGPKFLSLFKYGFNIHPSALPKYRGPSPITAAILNADDSLLISVQSLALGMDEGDIWTQGRVDIDLVNDDEESVRNKVALSAPELVGNVLKNIDSIIPKKQEGQVSYTSFVKKEDGKGDLSLSGQILSRMSKAYNKWPKLSFTYKDKPIYILDSIFEKATTDKKELGKIVSYDNSKGFAMNTIDGIMYLRVLQLPGKGSVKAADFKNGNKDFINSFLTNG